VGEKSQLPQVAGEIPQLGEIPILGGQSEAAGGASVSASMDGLKWVRENRVAPTGLGCFSHSTQDSASLRPGLTAQSPLSGLDFQGLDTTAENHNSFSRTH
jgi:hypothetical protein